jgi:putative ABC transport system permease protein
MKIKTHIREALRQLTSSKLRAFLAVLGILVGTASVVAMVSIGRLAENQILLQFEQLGINLLSVSIYSDNYNSSNANPNATLSLVNAENINAASNNITMSAPYISNYGNIVYQGKTLQGSSVGITPNMMSIADLTLLSGRNLSFLDANDYFCLIGNQFYQSIEQQGVKNPIGSQIAVGNTIFTIIGVLAPWQTNWFFNTDFNNAVLIPIGTALSIQKNATINSIALKINNTTLLPQTEKDITNYIQQHTLKQQVNVRSPKSIIDSMKASSATMTLLLGLIGSISLIVGGIGVMNIMLVSVAERHKEIGIRLAIGAKQRDIQLQFLIESVTLSIFGGIAGMLLGVLVTYGVSLYSKWTFSFFILPPLLGCLVSVLVGIFFGFYPARKASKLDPILTLRSE